MKYTKMPEELEFYTADEVAECIGYWKYLTPDRGKALYVFLFKILAEAKNKTPLGGDGSGGTVETPDGRLCKKNDDKSEHWWGSLDQDWQEAIVKALNQ